MPTLTAARSKETTGAVWSEIDLDTRTWKVPAERMKARVEHKVPLSDRAMQLIEEALEGRQVRGDERVFGVQSATALIRALRDMGIGEDATIHGFRSTFRDWAAEQTSFREDIVEKALAHGAESETVAAYKRSDLFALRRDLMAAWAAFCGGENQDSDSKVVQLRQVS